MRATARQQFFEGERSRIYAIDIGVSFEGSKRSFLYTSTRLAIRKIGIVGLAAALAGCAVYTTHPGVNPNSLSQVRTQSDGPVRVMAAVLGAEESKSVFGVPVYDSGVQPVWLSIENRDQVPYAFFSTSVDQNRFSPLEAAYRSHYRLFFSANRKMDTFFLQNAIGQIAPAGETVSGFVYTNRDLGAKYAQVELVGPKDTKPKLFSFLLPVPENGTHEPALSASYRPEGTISYDEKGLHEALQRLPCCTTSEDGTVEGDPLNLVFIGEMDEIFSALFDRQWNITEQVDLRSSWEEVKAFLFGISFPYAPASSLYFYGRRQDVTVQKPRATIEARNHLRLWQAPMRFEGKPVWVGQVSRDIGIRFTVDTWNLTTHRIDPHVDDTREYLLQDLFRSRLVSKVGYVRGGAAATLDSPRTNLTGDPYITDGLRAVLVFSRKRVSDSELQALDWELPSSEEFRKGWRAKGFLQK